MILQRDVAVLLGKADGALAGQHIQRLHNGSAGIGGVHSQIGGTVLDGGVGAANVLGVGGSLGLVAFTILSEAKISSLYRTVTAASGARGATVQPLTATRQSALAAKTV